MDTYDSTPTQHPEKSNDNSREALDRFKQRLEPSNTENEDQGLSPWLLLGGVPLLGALASSDSKPAPLFRAEAFSSTKTLGSSIRNRRKDKQLTQEQLADLAGVGARFVIEIEQGKDTAEIGKVLLLLDALDLELKVAQRG